MSQPLDTPTRLAVDRTRLAHDRTMMAWVRTATSMITLGFGVYKFFALDRGRTAPAGALIGPREFSLLLVLLGLCCLIVATVEYRGNMRSLRAQYPGMTVSRLAAFSATVLSALGVLALLAVLFRR